MEENKIYHPGKEEQHLEALKADLDEMGIHFTQVAPIGCGFALFSLRNRLNPL